MLVSLNWLKKYTDLPADNDLLIKKIGAQVAEVESVVDLSQKYQGIVVAEIAEAGAHPDADKLGLYKVNNGTEVVQVVAGDKSLSVGDKVAYIAPGVIVPSTWGTDEPFVIEKRPLRGQESNGMMASTKELDWGDDHSHVLKLDSTKPAGTSLIEAYELDDLIIEIENKTLTHRPDCFGMIGFAREVAGVNGIKFSSPDWFADTVAQINATASLPLSVEILAEECARYVGVTLDGVTIKESPQILQTYLARVGIRPINNVVDITNYLMVETGQPLHAFDYDKTKALSSEDANIIVRHPAQDEKITLLDGREVKPHEKAVLICTDQKAIAIGGAMGGSETEIDDNTKRIIIESASFDLYNLRRTSMAHGIFTEAVTRFIRGQSPDQCLPVAARAVSMVVDLAVGQVASDFVDVYPNKQDQPLISVEKAFINERLGSEYSASDMTNTLNNVEIGATEQGGLLQITAPFWRRDLNIAEDVVEEVGRLYGYDLLPATLPQRNLAPARLSPRQQLIIDARKVLVETGANEVLTYNFRSEKELTSTGLSPDLAFKLVNSISPELQVLRTALLPSLISKIHQNIKSGYQEFALFEINKSHRNNLVENDLPVEEHSLAYVFAADERIRSEATNGAAYYQSVHVMNYLLDKLSMGWTELVPLTEVEDDWLAARAKTYNPNRAAVLVSDDGVVGVVGEFANSVISNNKLPIYSSGFDLNVIVLENIRTKQTRYLPQLKYPGTQQDVTFAVSAQQSARDVLETIAAVVVPEENMQNSVSIVDIYQKTDDQKNLTYRLEMRHKEHTLTTEEASDITSKVVEQVVQKHGAKQV